jgi:hypothetical protein
MTKTDEDVIRETTVVRRAADQQAGMLVDPMALGLGEQDKVEPARGAIVAYPRGRPAGAA